MKVIKNRVLITLHDVILKIERRLLAPKWKARFTIKEHNTQIYVGRMT